MPYDNNLSAFKAEIVGMLQQGVAGKNVVVVIQIDQPGPHPMQRAVIGEDAVEWSAADTGVGSSASALADFLAWAATRVAARKWGVVFLGHGGGLDEFSPDGGTGSWMRINDAAAVVAEFNATRDVQLLYLQNCCKGTLEAIYAFRECAAVTLSSATEIGAPNYYYVATLRFLGSQPEVGGFALASKIVAAERSDMYKTLCLTSNAAAARLPAMLAPVIEAALRGELDPSEIDQLEAICGQDDRLVDVEHLLQSLSTNREVPAIQTFVDYYRTKLIIGHMRSEQGMSLGLSGLALRIPRSLAEIERYRHLELYADTRISDLYRWLLAGTN